MTYLDLWKKIAARHERVLVVEDDVQLHESWRDVLSNLKMMIESGAVQFQAETPCLLRMGWALGKDHDQPGPVRLENDVRMSNPCFAVTSAYAAKAASNFKGVDQTADVYFHQQLPESGQAFTIFPPIASELSWSTGQVSSLIHPKDIHAEYLEAKGEYAAAAKERAKVQAHPKHMYHRKFLVVGHPRTGTGYAASLLRQLGFDIGHEKAGDDGLSSWMFAADAERYPYAQDDIAASRRSLHWNILLHIVRDPATAVASIMRDNIWAPPFYQFRREHILKQTGVNLDAYTGNFERSVMSLICWSRMILQMKPDCWFRLENAHEVLPRFLASRGLIEGKKTFDLTTAPVNADKLYAGEQHPKSKINDEDWFRLPPEVKEGIQWYCNHFGYCLPGKLNHRSPVGDGPLPNAVNCPWA